MKVKLNEIIHGMLLAQHLATVSTPNVNYQTTHEVPAYGVTARGYCKGSKELATLICISDICTIFQL